MERTRSQPPEGRRRILVVDDNQDSAESLGMLIELLGNDVRTASDGLSALRIASEFRPGVAFLDIGLPGMSGYELARRLRALADRPKITLVAVTGWSDPEARARAFEAGFEDLVVKPMDIEVLKRILLASPADTPRG